jgi:hypothetical protein
MIPLKAFFRLATACGRARHIFNEDIFKGDLPIGFADIFTAGRDQFIKRVFLIDRHEHIAGRIIIPVQGNGQFHLQPFLCQFFDLGNNPDGRNGDMPAPILIPLLELMIRMAFIKLVKLSIGSPVPMNTIFVKGL